MFVQTASAAPAYTDITPLCPRGHVMLVRSQSDGQLYVKKQLHCYHPELYQQLMEHPVEHTPLIHELHAHPDPSGGARLTIIEEYLPGSTLAELLEEQGLFSEQEVIDIALQLCQILTRLHAMEPAIIHRDIKPSNVILTAEGTVKLLDFSAAKPENAGESRDTVLLGTAGFAAPEQYGFSSSTPQTDLYAVGVLMNMLLTGALPWQKTARGSLERVIRRCLKLNPKDRYAGAWELQRVLQRMRRVRYEWLPPGFRTLHPAKMLLALPCYLFIIIFSFRVDTSAEQTLISRWLLHLTFFLLGFLPILFYCNYMDIQRLFPFLRSSRPWLRILGLILAPVIIFLLVIVLISLLHLLLLFPQLALSP